MKSMRRGGILLVLLLTLGGCGQHLGTEKVKDLEYTVVEESEIPPILVSKIQDKKTKEFKETMQDGEYLYIARGYGERRTGGYSIRIKELYQSENAIYYCTELLSPDKNESDMEQFSYPYIVIKTEASQFPVVFE